MRKATIIGMLLMLGVSSALFAIDNVKFSGKLLYRYEMDNRDWVSTQGNNSYLQTRLNAVFQPSYDVKVMVQLQDSRKSGHEEFLVDDDDDGIDETNNPTLATLKDGSADSFDLHQGYVQLTDLFINNFDLKLGRYEVSYGPQRLIGAVGWHFIGRSFDGFTATYHHSFADIDLFNLKLVNDELDKTRVEADSLENDNYLTGLYANFKFDGYTAQAFYYTDNYGDRTTMGVYAKGKIFGGLSHETEYAIQTVGDLTATMMGLNFTYALNDYKISGGYDYLSGADATADQGKFFNGYGTNHKYYGLMDKYLSTPDGGLVDTHFKLAGVKFAGVSAKLAYHIFNSDIEYVGAEGNDTTELGSEVDLIFNKKLNDNVKFQLVHSTFTYADETIDPDTWWYLATIVKF